MLIRTNFLNNFFLLLRKFVYLYEYMDDWENFNETSPHEIEDFHSYLNMEDITEADFHSYLNMEDITEAGKKSC